MVDVTVVNRLVSFIENQLAALKRLAIPNLHTFIATHHLHKTVLHDLQEVIQACIDIGNHIIADEGFRQPEDYRDIFAVLAEEGIVTRVLQARMEHMVGFRNLIVHMYEKVDLEIVYAIYRRHLVDFLSFIKAIRRFVRRKRKR